ncbi:MAG: AI-2E family transporter [Alphaproteobacteria bacterium]
MTPFQRLLIGLGVAVVVGALFNALREVLMPFLIGAAAAYLLDPVVVWLQRFGWSRALSTTVICVVFAGVVAGVIFVIAPLLYEQIVTLIGALPELVSRAIAILQSSLHEFTARLSPEQYEKIQETVGGRAGEALSWLASLLGGVWSGGLAVISIISLVFITPLVTFYLMRDWPKVVASIDRCLPRDQAGTIRAVLADIDRALAGFIRGQALVCLFLGVAYAIALTIAGLQFALLLGILIGVLAVIPIVGTAIGAVACIGLAIIQFGTWEGVLTIAAIFAVIQAFEGNILQPKLVGDRVGLHPLWIVFALMAGGALMGFIGVLVAVPAAAAIGVLARFGVSRYLAGSFYRGDRPAGPQGGET